MGRCCNQSHQGSPFPQGPSPGAGGGEETKGAKDEAGSSFGHIAAMNDQQLREVSK